MVESKNMRLALVTLGSAIATTGVIMNAFYQKKQFYPSVVYLTKSNPSIAVLYAQVFVFVFLLGKAMRKIFFGQLRAAEIEHLIEKFWYVITETCLAFTVFRDDFSPKFVAMFTFLLFMKAFHWLVEDRVDYMERTPIITLLFHTRVSSLLMFLGTIDAVLILHAFRTTLASGASVQMVFGFEYAILLVMVVAVIMKYVLHTIDYLSERPWDNKNVYLLYADLITGFVKCCLYIVFVGVMVKIHTFPLFAIRPMYLTIRAFKKSLSDVILSRRAIAYMNTRFSNATEEELSRLDNTCIICREQMSEGKKLPCNHIFHTHCLRSWFQRQQSCPTCRMDVLSSRVQQQQQTPVRPQPVPPQPPQRMPPHAGGFMGVPPPQASPFGMPIPPQQSRSSDTTTTHSAVSSNANTTAGAAGNVPPIFSFPGPLMPNNPMFMPSGMMFPPPPPFMPMPSMFSPPNLNLSALSVEELRAMEGQERENVEARLRLLRNVHSMLDSVILQLNQYSQVITHLNAMTTTDTAATTSTTTTTTTCDVTPSTSVQTPVTSVVNEPITSVKPVDLDVFSRTGCSTETTVDVENVGSEDVETDNEKHPFIVFNASHENELRRRRLEKFQSPSTVGRSEGECEKTEVEHENTGDNEK